jgi:hypothetical protein
MLSRLSDILAVVVVVPVLAAFVLLEYGCELLDALRCVSLLLIPLLVLPVPAPVVLPLLVMPLLAVLLPLVLPMVFGAAMF